MKKKNLNVAVLVSILIMALFISFNNRVLAQTVLNKAQALSIVTNTTTVYTNQNVTIKGTASSKNGVLYKFWQYDDSTKKWTILNNYSDVNSISWTPSHSGEYKLVMHVKDKKSSAVDCDDYKYIIVNALPAQKQAQPSAKAQAQSISTNISNIYNNQSVTVSGTASSKNGVLYKFWQYDDSTKQWTLLNDYGDKNSISWTPTHSGQYKLVMHVKDKQSNASDCDDYSYIVVNSLPVPVQPQAQAQAQSVSTNASTVYINQNVTIQGTASSKNGVLYKFWQYDDSTKQWTVLENYSDNNLVSWTPAHSGDYKLVMHVKDKQSTTEDCDDYKTLTINVSEAKAKSLGIKTDTANVFQNDVVKILGSASSKDAVLYRFWEYDASSQKWTIIRDYNEDPNLNWTPSHTGDYSIVMHVKDKYSDTTDCDDYSSMKFKVYNCTSITDFNINNEKLIVGNKYTLTANSVSKNAVSYKFMVYDYGKAQSTILKDYNSNNTSDWVPASNGKYKVTVYLRDEKTSMEYNESIDNLSVRSGQLAYKVIVLDAGHGGYLNGCYDSGAYNENTAESNLNSMLVGYIGDDLTKLGATVIYARNEINMKYSSTAQNLQDRIDVANKINADLFLSIHHDSSTSSGTTGVSAHYSSYRPAIDNSGTYVSDDITYDSTPCQQVLDSIKLAKNLVNELSNIGFANRGISDHNLYVTEHATVPAVLLECGFMSNHSELTNISNANTNQHMADSIVKAILGYFNN